MSISIRNPRDPKKPKRKFQPYEIDHKSKRILTEREKKRFMKLSYKDRLKLNRLYAKVILNVQCRHKLKQLKAKLNNGFTCKQIECCKCGQVLEITLYRDRGFGCPFPNPKNV